MVLTNDIYFKIDSNIVSQNFWGISIEEKKRLIDLELKKYIISKIQESDNTSAILNDNSIDLSVGELLSILASDIPMEKHFNTLRHFIHYIVQVAGGLQNRSITWWQEDEDELIPFPLVEFDENGLWTNLKTHEKTDYVQTFNFVYEIFNNNFMTKNNPKKLVMRLPENEG